MGIVVLASVLLSAFGLLPAEKSTGPYIPPPENYRDRSVSDRELKDRPGLARFSERDKELIISEAKKFDAAVKELERKRGY